jgi:hypothetical protein
MPVHIADPPAVLDPKRFRQKMADKIELFNDSKVVADDAVGTTVHMQQFAGNPPDTVVSKTSA